MFITTTKQPLNGPLLTTIYVRRYKHGRFTKAQNREFFHTMTAQKSYYVSATAIVIENLNNCLRNRKLDFTQYAHVLLSVTYHWLWESGHACNFPNAQRRGCPLPRPVLVAQNSDPWYARQELGYFEVVGVVFWTVVVAFGWSRHSIC